MDLKSIDLVFQTESFAILQNIFTANSQIFNILGNLRICGKNFYSLKGKCIKMHSFNYYSDQ